MKSQKLATKKAREEWAAAVADQRVIRHEDGRLISYPTLAARDYAIASILDSGATIEIVGTGVKVSK